MGFVCVLCSLELLHYPKYITIITFYCDVIKGTNSQLYSSKIANRKGIIGIEWTQWEHMRMYIDEETTQMHYSSCECYL